MKYGFIGCGNMGGAVARAVCKGAGSGDVLLAKGDAKGAREAYSKGIESNASQALQVLLRMKLNNLSS